MADPILIDFPDHIETERLIIRSPQPGDGTAVHQSACDSQDFLKPWMVWAVELPDEQGYEKWARQNQIDFIARKNMAMIVILKADGKVIGGSGFHNLDWKTPSFEIGYWLNPNYTGKGYMTEVVNALSDFAFDTLKAMRVEIRCADTNKASAAVAERAGYTLDTIFKNHRRHHISNDLLDTRVYSKTI
ncbi:MAG: GNAT family N-acetyltransferase [Anaerolineae bacterium]